MAAGVKAVSKSVAGEEEESDITIAREGWESRRLSYPDLPPTKMR